MIDRDITISNLDTNIRWIEDNPSHQFPGWGNVTMAMRDAIELLKEQPEIVRCKDCVFRDPRDGMCEHVLQIRDPDWYCADGERRDDDG